MSVDQLIAAGVLIVAFAGLCLGIWKIRAADWREINSKIQSCTIELAAFKLHVAELHPTAAELARIESRLIDALNGLSARIDRLLERDNR